ncbi:MAG: PHP domain-containing protein [Bacteroidota bacterium]
MKQFRYDTSGHWYKGNVHLHSTVSDGGKTFGEMAALYAAAGYDFLFRTDHWAPSDTSADAEAYPLLWLDGVEFDGRDHTGAMFHFVCLGPVSGIDRAMGLAEALRAAREQGALIVLAHPHWCGNTTDDGLRWRPDGVEVYNHVCHWLNGKSGGLVHWEAVLRQNPNALAFAVDDAHLRPEHPGWNGGWIVVNAGECSASAIMASIRRGNFFATCGPEFRSIQLDGRDLRLRTSPVRFIRLAGPGCLGKRLGSFDGPLMTEAVLTVPEDWDYVYLEIEDEARRRAWTNGLFAVTGGR